MRIVPTTREWRRYGRVTKATIIGTVVGIVSLAYTLVLSFVGGGKEPTLPADNKIIQQQSGSHSPNVANVEGNVTILLDTAPADPGEKATGEK